MKKIYSAPQMKVVEVKNDIIATSGEVTGGEGPGYGDYAPSRGLWDEDFDAEDLY